MSLHYELSYIKQHYRDLFSGIQSDLLTALTDLRQQHGCHSPHCVCHQAEEEPDLFAVFPAGCGLRAWQQASLHHLEQHTGRDIVRSLDHMDVEKNKVQCHQCGVCCRFASSEFSWDALREKAQNGDAFATQFTSVFLPYASTQAAHQQFPELVDAIFREARLQQGTGGATASDVTEIYFYHCPFVAEDNSCSIYGTARRPGICSRYPETPLSFIYEKCAWKPWKDDHHREAMLTHAKIELCLFYAERIKGALTSSP